MEAILKFNLPEESEEHESALNGHKTRSAIFSFDQWLRDKQKFGDSDHIDIYDCREKLRDICYDNGINIDGETVTKN